MGNQIVPALRFSKFKVDYQVDQLGSVTDCVDYRGKAPVKSSSGIQLLTARNIKKGYLDNTSKEYIPVENYKIVMSKGLPKVGDILFTTEAPLGNVYQIKYSKIALAQRVIKFRSKKGLSNDYLCHYMLSPYFQKEIQKKSIGTTVKGISNKALNKLQINYPCPSEQQKIADFLSSVDKKIEQLTRKKELLEKYKTGMMQKLFPKAGEQHPELRFKDENGQNYPYWDEKKLEQISEIIGGGTPASEIEEFWEGEINWFTPTEIRSKYVSSSNRRITKLGLKKSSAKLLTKGSILFTSRATIGEVSFNLEEASTNQGFQNFTEIKANSEFLYQWLKRNKKIFLRKSQGSTFLEIGKSEIKKVKINLPTKHEQQKIANFLSAIDDKITKVEGKLTKAQTFKKGLLQQMFV